MNVFTKIIIAIGGLGFISGAALTTVAIPNQIIGNPIPIFADKQLVLSESMSYRLNSPTIGDRVVFSSQSGSIFVGIITHASNIDGEDVYVIYSAPKKPWNVKRIAIKSKIYYPSISKSNIQTIIDDKEQYPDSTETNSPTSGFPINITTITPAPTRGMTASPTPTKLPSSSATSSVFSAYIDGVAYVDENYNGKRDSYEKGLMGKDINIYMIEPSVALEAHVITNEDGYYKAKVSRAAKYQPQLGDMNMQYKYPVNAQVSISTQGELKRQDIVLVPLGKQNPESSDVPGVVQGFVFLDGNGNGAQDSGEGGTHFYKINLYNSSTGTQIATTVSSEDGYFTFTNLPLTSYRIETDNTTGQFTVTKGPDSISLSDSHTIDNSTRIGVVKHYD